MGWVHLKVGTLNLSPIVIGMAEKNKPIDLILKPIHSQMRSGGT